MAKQTTSAGYRLPVANSSYHEKCIAPSVKAIQEATLRSGDKTYPQGAHRDCNVVAQERVWREHVQKEHKINKSWKDNWAFITEYDYKGNPRPKKELPTNQSFFTTSIPPTTSKNFGASLKQPNSHDIYRIEMMTSYHRRRSDLNTGSGQNY